jgi:ribonucleoside-diphosphate reductase alpha chain
MQGPTLQISDLVHGQKYRSANEDFRESQNRIAGALQDNHDHYVAVREITMEQRFLFPGRVQSSMGALKITTSHNCFVMPTIHDSFVDGPTDEENAMLNKYQHPSASIMDVAKMSAQTMRQGGGVGYDFSTLRPSGDIIKGVQSATDGPMAFAGIYDMVCAATSSAGNRRGAQMGVMRIDHPDIERFIRAKQVSDDSIPWHMRPLRGFNLSVAITDEFLDCLASGKPFPLQFGGVKYREVDPLALWDMIMRGTYDWAEPGVLFIDQINRMNNLYYCETIAATNPCGEQPLPPHGACLLGSWNLTKYVVLDINGKADYFDYDQLTRDIPPIIRAMDNVIDRGRYPLPQQRAEALNKRRMGIGVTGLANTIEAFDYPYGTPAFLEMEDKILHLINNECYRASAYLAKDKGAFPFFNKQRYLSGLFVQQLDDDVQDLIRKYGIRNSHLTSIAPTGTISFCADNVSSGCEPVVALEQDRNIIMKEGPKTFRNIPDYGYSRFGVSGKTIMEVTVDQHIAVLCVAQKNVDSAVSKTCNVPTNYPFEDFKQIYLKAAEGGAKGCTTYRPAEKYDEPIKAAAEVTNQEACGWDPETGQRTGSCAD